MTTRTKLTHKTLALQARKLSGDIDGARWALAELAAQAQAEGVPGWAEIIGAECKRQPDTVEKWAHTWKWAGENRVGGYADTGKLPSSFFECAAKKADRRSLDTLIELLHTYERQPGTTYESFRAQLSPMTGGDGYGDFPAWAKRERNRVLDWIDRAPSRRAGDCLRLAADALADALEMETA